MSSDTNDSGRGTMAAEGTEEQMTDTTDTSDRLERFQRDLEAVGHRTSRGDRTQVALGAGAMVVGVIIAVAAYAMSTTQSDQRDVTSSVILGVAGLAVVVAGAAVFVKSALTEFLRFWMLRLLAERQNGSDT